MDLTGFHHLTAITANASANRKFYTEVLGLRLVKKTVNQDETSSYHLFYADAVASPGSDITFFDWPGATPERRGTQAIVRTGFRIGSEASLDFWAARLADLKLTSTGIITVDGKPTIHFQDPEGQRLAFVLDTPSPTFRPWEKSPIPADHQILGLGPITLSVPNLVPTEKVLTQIMNMRAERQYEAPATDGSGATSAFHVFRMGAAGPSGELHVAVEPQLPVARSGRGAVHHVAFRTPTAEQYKQWDHRLAELHVPYSGPVDRFYFQSLYFREPNRILFEIATDGPGFTADEPLDSLGEHLSLPPFLESRREQIESRLVPLA